MSGQPAENVEMVRVVRLTRTAANSEKLHKDDMAARDAAIWEYDNMHGDGSIRAIARACKAAGLRLSPSHVHRIIAQETARRQATAE